MAGVTVRWVRGPTRGLPRMHVPPDTASYRLMIRIVFPCMFTLIILTTGCGGQKYVPDITLTNTGPIIDAIAEFHNLYPAYALLSGKETFGLDAPKTERVEPSELTSQVESELLKELDAAGIFSRITRFNQNPDVILSGRITALHEHYRPQTWAKIPNFFPLVGMITQILRLKTHVNSGEAHLTLFVLKSTGEVLGTYPANLFSKRPSILPKRSLPVPASIEPCPKPSIKFRTRSPMT